MQRRTDFSRIGTQKTEFWDRSQKFRYLIMTEVARRLLEQPGLVDRGRHYLETSMAHDTQLASSYRAWKNVIDRPVEEIVRRWLDDTDEGDTLRANPPLFDVVMGEARKRASDEAGAWAKDADRS